MVVFRCSEAVIDDRRFRVRIAHPGIRDVVPYSAETVSSLELPQARKPLAKRLGAAPDSFLHALGYLPASFAFQAGFLQGKPIDQIFTHLIRGRPD